MTTTNKDYHVVHFLDEQSTFVVPEWWIVRKLDQVTSFWPPYKHKDRVLAAIRQNEQITRVWSSHPVKILHSYTTLQHALDNVDAAAWTSNLDSDALETPSRRKRVRRPAGHVESDSSDDVAAEDEQAM